MTNLLLSIDPSINSLGYAIFMRATEGQWKLCDSGTVKAPKEYKNHILEERIIRQIKHLEREVAILSWMPTGSCTILIEQAQQFGGYKSTASQHSGSLWKLAFMVGALLYWARSFGKSYLIKVSTWKGQLPKRVTQERVEKKHNIKCATDDEADAIGLGDYWLEHHKDD